ncbi:MAG: endonuclease/exonuclease/phosphatase family protein, partial [Flavobacterium sp.]|nr:endonuclease/exonuclease/phosphatase family protein [Flavobacterium sp.]
MRIRNVIVLFVVLFAISRVNAQAKKYNIHTVAFYNLENFYDTINDPNTRDDEWVYTKKFFIDKQNNIAKVISLLGKSENPNNSPTIIGLAEVENRMVLEALVKNPLLIDKDYGIIHFESPDRRGIDCAFLYQKKHFKPTSFTNVPLYIYEKDTKTEKKEKKEVEAEIDDRVDESDATKRIYTRDQILMTG